MFLSITEFAGRFHPLLVHLPIGILLMALMLQWLSKKSHFKLPAPVTKLIWWTGIIAAIFSCITGYLLSLTETYDEDTVTIHMWMGIAVAAVSLLVASKIFTKQFDLVYKISFFSLFALIMLTGHFGGSLTHGSDYLSLSLLGEAEKPAVIPPVPNAQEALVYKDVIHPLLEARCNSCHGPTKQKGKLRMDTPDFLLRGGKNGEVLMPGQPDESELVKRILLPESDDHHMPPKEKTQLTKDQVALLQWWIEVGCPIDKKIKEIRQPEAIKASIASLEKTSKPEAVQTVIVPEEPVEAADSKAIAALEAKGVIVTPVAQNSNYLMASFVTASAFSDADTRLLIPLAKQLVWLKIGNTNIGDSALQAISKMNNLVLLQLNGTAVTDKGLPLLKSLKQLQSLNLVNTSVSAKGISELQSIKTLRSLYVYQSGFRPDDYAVVKKLLPLVEIDTGGYHVPLLPSDTSRLTKPVDP